MARTQDGLHKRKGSPFYYCKVPLGNGRYREVSTKETKYADAVDVRNQALAEARKGQLPNQMARWTLQAAIKEWLEYRGLRIADASLASERTHVAHLLAELGAGRKLKSIATLPTIEGYQSARRKAGASPKTVNNEVVTLSGLLQRAKLWHRIRDDYRPLKVSKSEIGKALTPEESIRLHQAALCLHSSVGWAAVLAHNTGARKKEVISLRLGDIDIDQQYPVIRIRRSTTKTDAGARDVALNNVGVWALQQLIQRAKLLGASMPEHFLFAADLSKHTKPSDGLRVRHGFDPTRHQHSWDEAWKTFCKQAGLPGLRFHNLRHTYITRGAEAGVPIEVMMAQVGHMSAEMVRYYTHISTRAKHQAARAIQDRSPELVQLLGIEKSQLTDDVWAPKVPQPLEVDRKPDGVRDQRCPLTPSEHRVLKELKLGQQDKEIAATLNITPRTVHFHVSNILRKMGLSRRTEILARNWPC